MYHSEHDKLTKAEKLTKDYEINGYLTPGQFTELRMVIDDPAFSDQVREALMTDRWWSTRASTVIRRSGT